MSETKTSWWLDAQTREEFAQKVAAEQLRMALSREAAQVHGMVVAWGKSVGGKR